MISDMENSESEISLFDYLGYKDPEDVPDDLIEEVVASLRRLLYMSMEYSQHSSKPTWEIFIADEGPISTMYETLDRIRQTLALFLVDNRINGLTEAISVLKDAIDAHKSRLVAQKSPYAEQPWVDYLKVYTCYADLCVRAGQFNEEIRALLEHTLEATDHPSLSEDDQDLDIAGVAQQARMNIALVLQEMGIDQERQQRLTALCKKHINRHPAVVKSIAEYFQRLGPYQSRHPLYRALGPKWFEDRPLSVREQSKIDMVCLNCRKSSTRVALSRCKGCKTVSYCSRECQKAHWPRHRQICKDNTNLQEHIQHLKETNPSAARVQSELLTWRGVGVNFANTSALVHALQLQRDISRARMHIVIRRIEYVPPNRRANRSLVRSFFNVTHCGVFKMSDVYSQLDKLSQLNPGQAKFAIERELKKLDAHPADGACEERISVFHWDVGMGVDNRPMGVPVIARAAVQGLPYDPDWRKFLNEDKSPAAPLLLPGLQDMEHIF